MVAGEDGLSKEAQRNATTMFMALLRGNLASKRILKDYKLTQEAFDWLVGEVETRFNQAQANAGECVGTVAAQSLGEPTTQVRSGTARSSLCAIRYALLPLRVLIISMSSYAPC